jgi:copper chaperone CopZ
MNKMVKHVVIAAFAFVFATPLRAAEQKATIKVYGMTCQMCANGVAGSLKQLKGVKSADVSVKDGQAVVTYDDQQATVAQIEKQIEKSGFSTKPKSK